MKLDNLKTGSRLGLGFGIIIVLTLALGGGSIMVMEKLSKLTADLYNHPLTVSIAVRDIRTQIMGMHSSMRDVVLAEDDIQVLTAIQQINLAEQHALDDFNILFDRFLGDLQDVERAHISFLQWKKIRDQVIDHKRQGRDREANRVTRELGASHVLMMENQIRHLTDFASNKADTFLKDAQATKRRFLALFVTLLGLVLGLGILVSLFITRGITKPLSEMVKAIKSTAAGDLEVKIPIQRNDEIGDLADSLQQMVVTLKETADQANVIAAGNYGARIIPRSDKDELSLSMATMTRTLQKISEEHERYNWLRNGQAALDDKLRGELELQEAAERILSFIANYLNARVGTLYLWDEKRGCYKLQASYAYTVRKNLSNEFGPGEGMVGQAALEKKQIIITQVPEEYIKVTSGLGEHGPLTIVVTPFVYNDEVKAVLELGGFHRFSDQEMEFLDEVGERLAIAIHSAQSRVKLREMLSITQEQAQELESQQEELRVSNEELQEQTEELKSSKAELQAQQEELRVTNEELEEKTFALEQQKKAIELQNEELAKARLHLEKKAEELSVTSKYKSEFLANMSHELRTPLNSLLLLARTLSANKEGNLSEDQVESAEIIHKSGQDLLLLINEILDLSKIEAGRMEMEFAETSLREVAESLSLNFRHLAEERGLGYTVEVNDDLPGAIITDRQRLEQILKNLVSNGLKFTRQGEVTVRFGLGDDSLRQWSDLTPENSLLIVVRDTGIGISEEHQKVIFQAFQQADGSTARKFGGTGLGLSISRELAKLLGGTIHLESSSGQGSVFSLVLPLKGGTEQAEQQAAEQGSGGGKAHSARAASRPGSAEAEHSSIAFGSPGQARPVLFSISDDRQAIGKGDKVILVIEDDENFARILMKQSHAKGFKCLLCPDGEEGLKLADRFRPTAIILDIKLPGMSGWDVLDRLKKSSELRHIPVHMMSVEEASIDALKKGALAFLAKPVSEEEMQEAFSRFEAVINRDISKLLVVEDDTTMRREILRLIGNGDVKAYEAASGAEALEALTSTAFDCMVLDLGLPDMSGFDLLDAMEAGGRRVPPVIVYTGRDLSREETERLRHYTDSIIIKGVKSEERLLDETALFLHRVVSDLPEHKRNMIASLHDQDSMFAGKSILLVDDDMRNTFALAKVLREKAFEVSIASDGQQALHMLEEGKDVDLVLMDIMMPVMDGYEAIGKIRAQSRFWNLPIIALTAKAMKEDRQKCMEAGASDYLSKPVDVERLLSMMRVWLYR